MTDCLQKNINVGQPDTCSYTDPQTGETVNVDLYEWMSIRAAGPNYLKDTTLCGTTHIEGIAIDPPNAIVINCAKEGTAALVNDDIANVASPLGYASINGGGGTYLWTVNNFWTAGNENRPMPTVYANTPYITYPTACVVPNPAYQNGLIALQNNTETGTGDSRLTLKCTLAGQCNIACDPFSADVLTFNIFCSRNPDPTNSASILTNIIPASINTVNFQPVAGVGGALNTQNKVQQPSAFASTFLTFLDAGECLVVCDERTDAVAGSNTTRDYLNVSLTVEVVDAVGNLSLLPIPPP